jgi:hypothetical protein
MDFGYPESLKCFHLCKFLMKNLNAELGFAWLIMQLFNGAVLNKMLLSVEGY